MRRLVVVLAAAALALGGPIAAAQAAGEGEAAAHYSVLTPDQIGLTEPGQGFFPYFLNGGQSGSSRGSGIGLGGLAPTTLGASAVFNGQGGCGIFSNAFCPFFSASPYTSTFLSQGFNLAGANQLGGLGGLNSLALGHLNGLGLGTLNTFGGALGFNSLFGGLGGTGTVVVLGPNGTLRVLR